MQKKIDLKQLTLQNFKGIKSLTLPFNTETFVYGANSVGKTTLFDAFTWVLFGKDHTGRQDFEVKTKKTNGDNVSKVEHFVEAILQVDESTITIKRVLKEKWVKKKGSLEAELTGNETTYFWNDVPKKQREFQTLINELLDENLFKIVTNPLAFNALKWTDRRAVLIEMAGNISDVEFASRDSQFASLVKELSNTSLKDLKTKKAYERKKLNDEIKAIPTRIDEVVRNKPEEIDFKEKASQKTLLEGRLQAANEKLEDKSKQYDALLEEKNKRSQEIFNIKGQLSKIEFETKSEVEKDFFTEDNKEELLNHKVNNQKNLVATTKSSLIQVQNHIQQLKNKSNQLEEDRQAKTKLWHTENARLLTFDDNSFNCPSCKRPMEQETIEQEKAKMKEDFNKDKSEALLKIQKDGISIKTNKEQVDKEIVDQEAREKTIEAELKSQNDKLLEIELELNQAKENKAVPVDKDKLVADKLNANQEYEQLKTKVAFLEKENSNEIVIDNEEIKAEIQIINSELKLIEADLSKEDQIKQANQRIANLEAEESKLAQQISEIEKAEFAIQNFEFAKMTFIEESVNSKFQLVNFKLFETQINGAEVPCCIAMVNGVPFPDLNNAMKINAGLDIINALSSFYNVQAPVFIDNRESVTELIPSKSQIINLVVSKEDKTLRIS